MNGLAESTSSAAWRSIDLHDRVVPMHHPRLLVEIARAEGIAVADLLQNTEIRESMLANPDARISYAQFGKLSLNALRLTDDPTLGVRLGRQVGVSHLGVLGLAMMSSPDVGTAIGAGLRYYRMLVPAWDLSLDVNGERARFVARPALALGPLQMFATEALLAALEGQMEFLLGEPLEVEAAVFPYSRPEHVDLYGAPPERLVFDTGDQVEVVFDSGVLARPLPYADPVTVQVALRRCEEQLSPLMEDNVVARVRRALASRPQKYADLHTLAQHLRTNTRALRRELRAAGTSFQILRDAVRREQAIAQVLSTRLSSEEVGKWLGFADGRSFRRAFQRWTGHTLNEYRELHGVADTDSEPPAAG